MSDPTAKLALELFKKMSPKGKALNLEELRSLLDKVPVAYRKQVQSVLSKHIFTSKSFEMDSKTFCKMYAARFKVKPPPPPSKPCRWKGTRVAINLRDIVDFSDSEKEEELPPLSFTERVILRLEKRKGNGSSLKKILDDSEVICENISQILEDHQNDIDKDLKSDLIAVRKAYSKYCDQYIS